jgi:hypothetical protein
MVGFLQKKNYKFSCCSGRFGGFCAFPLWGKAGLGADGAAKTEILAFAKMTNLCVIAGLTRNLSRCKNMSCSGRFFGLKAVFG